MRLFWRDLPKMAIIHPFAIFAIFAIFVFYGLFWQVGAHRAPVNYAPLFEILDNGIKSEWIRPLHGGKQIRLAGLPQLRQQGLFAAIALELRQLLANAESDIDWRLLLPVRRRLQGHH
jgi:hypothetical protein